MKFDSMKEDEFREVYTLSANYLLKHFLPGLDQKTLEENLKLFM